MRNLVILILCLLMGEDVAGNKLMVFLLDGVRWDYLDPDYVNLPGLRGIIERGVQVESLIPEFPSVSYPNHYSLMTGLHCQDHGFVDNDMYDVETGKIYPPDSGSEHDKSFWFNEAEPFWITAKKQGKSVYMYNWIGCDVEIQDERPDHFRPYSTLKKIKYFRHDIDDGLHALLNGTTDIVGIYHEGIDDLGHRYGPKTPEVTEWLKKVDGEFSRLTQKLEDFGAIDDVNIMIFSDHGMTDVSMSRVINVTSVLPMENIKHVINGYGSRISIWPKDGFEDEIYRLLKNYDRHMRVFLKEDIPEEWYYTNNSRIAPLLLVADIGWYIDTPNFGFYHYDTGIMKGEHGYDPELKEMHGIFIATGPNFAVNYRSPSIRNIDLYQIMCLTTGVKPRDNNGTWSHVGMFVSGSDLNSTSILGILLAVFIANIL